LPYRRGGGSFDLCRDADGIVLVDVDNPETQSHAGRSFGASKRGGGWFVTGSSGVEYALLAAWRRRSDRKVRKASRCPANPTGLPSFPAACSPTTERQIRHATQNGFTGINLDPLELLGENGSTTLDRAITSGLDSLKNGDSVILSTALGPSADRGGDIDRIPGSRHRLGRLLGTILRRLVQEQQLTRAVIAGGDTSSHALKELHVQALTTLLPLPQTPGSPLCTAHGTYAATNGLQIALKGGQVGSDGYFAQVRDGLQE
jgi:uncharacterized protein YgbK (DUF1537 family)